MARWRARSISRIAPSAPFEPEFKDEYCSDLNAIDRARVQMIYIPATRDGASQVSSFLRSRLWRAITWSPDVREELKNAGTALNEAFGEENAVALIAEAVEKRWREVHTGGTDAQPIFRPVDLRFEEFVRKIEVVFRPDEEGRDRGIDDLSDGQRSLFHIAMTAATLDVERRLAEGEEGFQAENVPLPALTLVALEEPENNLAPFYLSRIVAAVIPPPRTPGPSAAALRGELRPDTRRLRLSSAPSRCRRCRPNGCTAARPAE
jgi:putative ATP-dependent endonuclease of OLD family